ncbi:MAG: TIGR02391 family protein [Bacteroidota bacterium]
MSVTVVKRPVIAPHHLESICQLIAATDGGLTGSEIGKILADSGIADPDPLNTKWRRLYNAFVSSQNKHACSNQVLVFLCNAMQPTRYFGKDELYRSRLSELNKRLAFIGTEMTERATLRTVAVATTLSEAQLRANRFKQKLEMQNIHSEIFKYCNPELLVDNYFHSVFEGVKSIADRLRTMTGIHADGNALVDVTFALSNPLIRINLLRNDTERSEHLGLANMMRGLFGLIRNPTAHTPKLKFVIDEEEALDIMGIISFVHKKLDKVQ